MDYKQKEILQKFAAEKIELNLTQRANAAKGNLMSALKSSVKQITSTISEIKKAEESAKQMIEYTDVAIRKAEELGLEDYIKRGQKTKKDVQMLLSNYQKAISDLMSIQKILKY